MVLIGLADTPGLQVRDPLALREEEGSEWKSIEEAQGGEGKRKPGCNRGRAALLVAQGLEDLEDLEEGFSKIAHPGRLKSCVHRVVAAPGRPRLSVSMELRAPR